jgi:hypothetical protein
MQASGRPDTPALPPLRSCTLTKKTPAMGEIQHCTHNFHTKTTHPQTLFSIFALQTLLKEPYWRSAAYEYEPEEVQRSKPAAYLAEHAAGRGRRARLERGGGDERRHSSDGDKEGGKAHGECERSMVGVGCGSEGTGLEFICVSLEAVWIHGATCLDDDAAVDVHLRTCMKEDPRNRAVLR